MVNGCLSPVNAWTPPQHIRALHIYFDVIVCFFCFVCFDAFDAFAAFDAFGFDIVIVESYLYCAIGCDRTNTPHTTHAHTLTRTHAHVGDRVFVFFLREVLGAAFLFLFPLELDFSFLTGAAAAAARLAARTVAACSRMLSGNFSCGDLVFFHVQYDKRRSCLSLSTPWPLAGADNTGVDALVPAVW